MDVYAMDGRPKRLLTSDLVAEIIGDGNISDFDESDLVERVWCNTESGNYNTSSQESDDGAIPGTFFWRPRFGLELAVPSTEPTLLVYPPSKKNLEDGVVVLIDGYDVLTSLIGLVQGIQFAYDQESMNPRASVYYTDAFRWALRSIDLLPYWIRGNFDEALSVWRNRFKYMDAQMPDWLRNKMFWVKKESWDKESIDQRRFVKDTELEFAAFYKYPSKRYNYFNSFLPGAAEQHIFSSVDRDNFSFRQASAILKSVERKRHDILHKARPRETTTTPPTTPPPPNKKG